MSGQCAPTLKRRSRYAEALRAQAHRNALDRFKLLVWHRLRWAPESFPLRPSALQSGNSALLQSLTFERAQCGQDCELKPSAGRPEIQALLQRDKRNVQGLQILEHGQKMFQIPSNPIQGPAHDHLNDDLPSIRHTADTASFQSGNSSPSGSSTIIASTGRVALVLPTQMASATARRRSGCRHSSHTNYRDTR